MQYKNEISSWIDAHEADFIRDTARLVAVRSVRGEAEEGAPFGPGPRAALDEAMKMCEEYGFKTRCYGGAVGAADLNGGERNLDILGHLDVVAEGEGWNSDPYKATAKDDGCLYGRGTDDDKGPVAAALLAMRCVRELGIPLEHNCRLIMGTDEESGSGDLPYYYSEEKPAPNTFTPDSGFPVYNVEKGSYKPQFSMEWPKETARPRVSSIKAGFRINVIPGDGLAVVLGLETEDVKKYVIPSALKCGMEPKFIASNGVTQIGTQGVQAHAAYPWEGSNGLTALLDLLASMPLADCASTRAVRALAELFPHGDWRGEALGVAMGDDVSGETTVSFTLLELDETGIRGQFDSRTAVCANDENCRAVVEERLRAAGFTVTGEMEPPHHTPAESKFVQTLLKCYEEVTGRPGECLYTGGGTYVHDIPGGVAFGPGMPGFDSHLHGADERMNIRDMLEAAKIFALSIAELCGAGE